VFRLVVQLYPVCSLLELGQAVALNRVEVFLRRLVFQCVRTHLQSRFTVQVAEIRASLLVLLEVDV